MSETPKRRHLSADEKLRILEEAQQPGVQIAELCRRHAIATSQFYTWREQAPAGRETGPEPAYGPQGPVQDRRRGGAAARGAGSPPGRRRRDHGGEPGPPKKRLKLGELSRTSAEVKAEVLALVQRTQQRSQWAIRRILQALAIPRAVYYAWRERAVTDRLTDTPPQAPRTAQLLYGLRGLQELRAGL